MSHKIEIYTKPFCAYCERAKELLRIKGIEFVEYDITIDRPRALEMQQRGKQISTPGIFINNIAVGGCKDLFDLDEAGALDPLLR